MKEFSNISDGKGPPKMFYGGIIVALIAWLLRDSGSRFDLVLEEEVIDEGTQDFVK